MKLEDSVTVGRFLFDKRLVRAADGSVKPNAMLPELFQGRLETSVCDLTTTNAERLRTLASAIRAPMIALALTRVVVREVSKQGLDCETAPQPDFEEHAVIVQWPSGADDKARRLDICNALVDGIRATSI